MTSDKKWSNDRLLTEACTWADALTKECYWHEDRCSWLGHSPDEAPQTGPLFSGVAALGPEFYAGTSGIAVFLACLNTLRPQRWYAETALGAIRHACHHATDVDTHTILGLHSGAIGIAFAAVVVGRYLDRCELVDEGIALAKKTMREAGDRPLLDVISGSASAISAALVMSEWTGDGELDELADSLGRNILDRAAERGRCWSWANSDCNGMTEWSRPLNGLAHGAAGVGVALLELHGRTKNPAYRDAGLGAFAYEDQFMTHADGNWKDLRVEDDSDGPHTTAWCHGAPGIALARLRALEIVPDCAESLRASVDFALRGTRAYAERQLEGQGFDVTSCHGLSGLIEPYVMASDVLGDHAMLDEARAMWRTALRRRADRATWLSGVGSGGKNPSLMLGSAGVGYALLRAHSPARVPSLLLLSPRHPSS